MKKNLINGFIVVALLACSAVPALAANNAWTTPAATGAAITDSTGTQGPGLSFDTLKFSANVLFRYNSDTTSGNWFALATYNTKGTKVYGTNSESSKIYATVADKTPTTYSSVTPISSGAWDSTIWAEVGQ